MTFNMKDRKDAARRPSGPEIKPGTYMGRIVGVVLTGKQKQMAWKGEPQKPPKEEFFVMVEFPKLRVEVDGESKPKWLSKRFKVIGSGQYGYENSNVFKMLDSLMDDCDYSTLVDKTVMCVLGKNSNGGTSIINISPAPDELDVPALENEVILFDFYDPDLNMYEMLPNWMREVCTEAVDFEGSPLSVALDNV
jgi:hypothetical protein